MKDRSYVSCPWGFVPAFTHVNALVEHGEDRQAELDLRGCYSSSFGGSFGIKCGQLRSTIPRIS
jgi:hypothetical protein